MQDGAASLAGVHIHETLTEFCIILQQDSFPVMLSQHQGTPLHTFWPLYKLRNRWVDVCQLPINRMSASPVKIQHDY